ncbi:MAG: competence/damage-inducible protein A [Euzebyaceae bacterium]|nr:competence/damage-inducible protein A [Euzebyaceae bacterium]
MSARLRVSVLVIGDEILGGFVQDTNSGWIAQRLQRVGVPLDRIVTVPDESEAVAQALQTELERARPRVVLTSGGIGSTPDDLTLEAVAASLGLPLVTEPEIDRRITQALRWSAGRGAGVTDEHERSMRRMAQVPEGARLLTGGEGLAPGIAVDVDGGSATPGGATIVILPGVPAELRRIMVEGVEPELLAGRGIPLHVAELTHGYPESTLNPILNRLVAEYPDVHVGSYPGSECLIRLKGPRPRVEEAMALVADYVATLDRTPSNAALRTAWQQRWR